MKSYDGPSVFFNFIEKLVLNKLSYIISLMWIFLKTSYHKIFASFRNHSLARKVYLLLYLYYIEIYNFSHILHMSYLKWDSSIQ